MSSEKVESIAKWNTLFNRLLGLLNNETFTYLRIHEFSHHNDWHHLSQ